jgi:hypothetical protein
MTDADDLAYLTDALKRLDAIHGRAPKGSTLSKLAIDARESVGILTGYLVPDGQISGATVADFIERGQRAQAAVDAIIADQPKRGR